MIRWKVRATRASRADNHARRLALGAAIDRAHLETAGAIVAGDPQAHAAARRAERELVEQQMAADAVSRTFVGSTVAEVEQKLIIDTLEHCLGNRTHAANILGISIRTLRNKLKEYSDAGVPVLALQGGVGAAA